MAISIKERKRYLLRFTEQLIDAALLRNQNDMTVKSVSGTTVEDLVEIYDESGWFVKSSTDSDGNWILSFSEEDPALQ